tara:strand:- start:1244 stop:1432 length:189 start_codon:yes stop_codon:yes gene_type:complete
MDYFLISFFRIRVVVLVLAFFVLCFFVGLLKELYAEDYCTVIMRPEPVYVGVSTPWSEVVKK